jgi:hypothetical protein
MGFNSMFKELSETPNTHNCGGYYERHSLNPYLLVLYFSSKILFMEAMNPASQTLWLLVLF